MANPMRNFLLGPESRRSTRPDLNRAIIIALVLSTMIGVTIWRVFFAEPQVSQETVEKVARTVSDEVRAREIMEPIRLADPIKLYATTSKAGGAEIEVSFDVAPIQRLCDPDYVEYHLVETASGRTAAVWVKSFQPSDPQQRATLEYGLRELPVAPGAFYSIVLDVSSACAHRIKPSMFRSAPFQLAGGPLTKPELP